MVVVYTPVDIREPIGFRQSADLPGLPRFLESIWVSSERSDRAAHVLRGFDSSELTRRHVEVHAFHPNPPRRNGDRRDPVLSKFVAATKGHPVDGGLGHVVEEQPQVLAAVPVR